MMVFLIIICLVGVFFLCLPIFFFFQLSHRCIDIHRTKETVYSIFLLLFKSGSLLTSQWCSTLEDFVLERVIEATLHFAMTFFVLGLPTCLYQVVFLNEDEIYARLRTESEKLEH